MSEQNKATLKKANAAIAKGDYEGFLSFCTEDTEWNFLGDRTLKGKAAVRNWMAEAYIEPPKFDAANLIAEGDFVAACGDISVKNKDGSHTRSSYCDVWRFHHGKMAELRAYVVEAKE